MKNILVVGCFFCLLTSCDRQPYVSHKVKLEKAGEDCDQVQNYFRVTANIAGERYEFEKCLPSDFSTKSIQSFRQGDTVVVKFGTEDLGEKAVVQKVILDIDSYPKYNFITINEDTYQISGTEK